MVKRDSHVKKNTLYDWIQFLTSIYIAKKRRKEKLWTWGGELFLVKAKQGFDGVNGTLVDERFIKLLHEWIESFRLPDVFQIWIASDSLQTKQNTITLNKHSNNTISYGSHWLKHKKNTIEITLKSSYPDFNASSRAERPAWTYSTQISSGLQVKNAISEKALIPD